MTSRVVCSACKAPLTVALDAVAPDFTVEWKDDENIIPRGHYWIAAGEEMPFADGSIVIHIADKVGLENHSDPNRHVGCCGPSAGVPNLVCGCRAIVATLVLDCWTSFYVHFVAELVDLVEVQAAPRERSA